MQKTSTLIVISHSVGQAKPLSGWAGLRQTLNCDDIHIGTMQNLSNVVLEGQLNSEFTAA